MYLYFVTQFTMQNYCVYILLCISIDDFYNRNINHNLNINTSNLISIKHDIKTNRKTNRL